MLFTKVVIKSCRGARECVSFVHVFICSYPAAILYLSRHMHYTMNAAWVLSDSYITSYLFPYFYVDPYFPFKIQNFLDLLYNNDSI